MIVVGSGFQKQEQTKSKLKDLAKRYKLAALYLLATDLRLDHESLLRILGGVQGINPQLARRIDHLWQIKFGKVEVEVPKPAIAEPTLEEIEKSSAFYYRDGLKGIEKTYKEVVFWDILTEYVSESAYDKGPLTRVRNKINEYLDRNYKTLQTDPTDNISVTSLFGSERPKTRAFELHIIEIEPGEAAGEAEIRKVQYALKYTKGDFEVSYGNLQLDIIRPIIKMEGIWE